MEIGVKYVNAYDSYYRPAPLLGSFAFSSFEGGNTFTGGTASVIIKTVEQLSQELGSIKSDDAFINKFIELSGFQTPVKILSRVGELLAGSKYDSDYISFDCTDESGREISITLANFLPINILAYQGETEIFRESSLISNLRDTLVVPIFDENDYVHKLYFINTVYTYLWSVGVTVDGETTRLQILTDSYPSPDALRKAFGLLEDSTGPRYQSLPSSAFIEIRIYDGWNSPFLFKFSDLMEGTVDGEFGSNVDVSQLPGFQEGPGYVEPGGSIKPSTPPYTPGGNSNAAGGLGNFGIDPSTGRPVQSDDIAPSVPGIGTPSGSFEGSVSNAGLFVHYAMNSNMLKVVGDWLWADDLGLIIAKEVLSILYGSPIESAISLMSYPFNVTALPGVVTRQQNIYWGSHEIGGLSGGISGTAITNPYATIDWGTIQLTEFWGNFLDYAPHTKLELYLPWCTGFVPIDPNECLPGSLRVVTNIELAKGTCLHNVIGNDGRVIATYTGTCGKQLPLTALDTSGKALALVGGAAMAAVVGGAAIAGGTAGAMYGGFDVAKLQGSNGQRWVPYDKPGNFSTALEGAKAGAGMTAKASKKPAVMAAAAGLRSNVSVPRNGTFTGSTAGLGVQYPYLIISRPTQSVPKQYGHHYGYPSNIYSSLLPLKGYTEIGEIHLTGFTCTDDELSEIDSLLKSGVIL